MVINRNVHFVVSFVILVLKYLEPVENAFDGNYYNLQNEKRRVMYYNQKKSTISQIFKNTIHYNGIAHIEINKLNPEFSKIKNFEEALKNVLGMNGLKYTFRRNFYWRTWREVIDSNGNPSLICYRCQNIINITCSSCNFCGHWEIDENSPCPFEIYYVINRTNICVANYNQLKYSDINCPAVVTFRELLNCGNPIKSRWRVSRQHDATNVSKRYINVICKERENCEFSTIYSIFPDYITFRVMNSSNDIIYSKIMKKENKNYACVNNCGILHELPNLQEQKTESWFIIKNIPEYATISYNRNSKKDPVKKIQTKFNPHSIVPNDLVTIYRRRYEKTATVGTLQCKHLQNVYSDEEYEESEYDN